MMVFELRPQDVHIGIMLIKNVAGVRKFVSSMRNDPCIISPFEVQNPCYFSAEGRDVIEL